MQWKPIHSKDSPDTEWQKPSKEEWFSRGTMLLSGGSSSPEKLQNRRGKLQMGKVRAKSGFCI